MQEIVHQLGELFLQAVPTVLIVFLFYLVMRSLFFVPLLKVMSERDARTAGARSAAEAAQEAARAKTQQYQDALKQARNETYAAQDAARKKLLEERNSQVKAARGRAMEEVRLGKERIAAEMAAARREVEASAGQLAAEIAGKLLQPPGSPAREAR